MAPITCPQCARIVPADEFFRDLGLCPFCGCHEQSDEAPADRSEDGAEEGHVSGRANVGPVEEARFTICQSVGRSVIEVVAGGAVCAAILSGMFALLGLCVRCMVQDPIELVMMPIVIAIIFWCVWCVLAVLLVPMIFTDAILRRTQRFWATGNRLHVQIGRKQQTLYLARCNWSRREPSRAVVLRAVSRRYTTPIRV